MTEELKKKQEEHKKKLEKDLKKFIEPYNSDIETTFEENKRLVELHGKDD